MVFKLAWRNIRSKPWRAAVTALAVAVAVTMIFCMLSFKGAVYTYIFENETADAGDSDVIITYNSSSDRITSAEPLNNIEGIQKVSPALSLFALFNDEYVKIRGFDGDKLEYLHKISVLEGNAENLARYPDRIAVSRKAAEKFKLFIGSPVRLTLGNSTQTFYVEVIAENDGYFLNDAPFVFVGTVKGGIARLIEPAGFAVYNEIYVKAVNGADKNKLIENIAALPEYESMKVAASKDDAYIEEKTTGLAAPIIIAGAAVVLLSLAGIALLFLLGEREKIDYAAKLTAIGATKKQILGAFLSESVLLGFAGSLLGTAAASGVFYTLLKFTLSSAISFDISAAWLFAAFGLGFVISAIASLFPLIRAFRGTIRENQLDVRKKSVTRTAFPIALILTAAVSASVALAVPAAKGALSAVSIILAAAATGAAVIYALKSVSRLSAKSSVPELKTASLGLARERRFSRSTTLLTIGITVSSLLFMAWSLTSSVFNSYIGEFSDIVMVSNIRADADVSEFTQVEGVKSASPAVWKTVTMNGGGTKNKTLNLIGTADALAMIDFGYVTDRATVESRINSAEGYVFLDIAVWELYGVKEGDKVAVSIDGVERELTVGGILSHKLFSGNYAIISSDALERIYGCSPDTVLLTVSGDADEAVGILRTRFADSNYYVVSALEAYRWDSASLSAVIDLIGALAVIISIFIFLTAAAAAVVGRASAERERRTLLSAGMSKRALLKSELWHHAIIAFISYVFAFAVSVLLTALMIDALRLFGLYFAFMYKAWVVAVAGGTMALLYALLPLVLNYKKGYNMKKT